MYIYILVRSVYSVCARDGGSGATELYSIFIAAAVFSVWLVVVAAAWALYLLHTHNGFSQRVSVRVRVYPLAKFNLFVKSWRARSARAD